MAPSAWTRGVFGTLLGLADGVTVYVEAAEAATTLPLFWASFGLVCLWYLLFSLPVVVDDLLRWKHEHGRVEDSVGWQLAVGHLRVTLHLSIVLQLLKPLGCNYRDHYHAPPAPSAPPPEAEAEAGSGSGYLTACFAELVRQVFVQQPKPDGTQHDASNHDERCQDLVIEAGKSHKFTIPEDDLPR